MTKGEESYLCRLIGRFEGLREVIESALEPRVGAVVHVVSEDARMS